MKKQKQAIVIFALVSISLFFFSCGIWPSGPEQTTKYYTFTFIVEADSCGYSSDAPNSHGFLTKDDSPFILELKTIAESPGSMQVTNYSDTSNVYINMQKTEGERFVEKDYIVKPNEFISIGMGQ